MSSAATALTLENVLYEKKGAIAYVTLNRPKVLNALNKATIAELNEVFKDARDDAAVRGVILTGAGDKAFAAGADIAEMANDTPGEAEDKTRHGQGPECRKTGDRSCEPGSRREPCGRAGHRGVALHPVFRYRGPERGRGRVPRKTQAELQRPVTRTGPISLALYSTERGKP